MFKNPQRNYPRAWRPHRQMTRAKLAEAVGATGPIINLIEAGERGLSDKWAIQLAAVLKTRPVRLFDTDPNNMDFG